MKEVDNTLEHILKDIFISELSKHVDVKVKETDTLEFEYTLPDLEKVAHNVHSKVQELIENYLNKNE